MAEKDMNLTSSKKEDEEKKEEEWIDLVGIIDVNTNLLYNLSDINFKGVYDDADEDYIKCVSSTFKTITHAQKALQKQINSFLKDK